jgi:hypothetical protein
MAAKKLADLTAAQLRSVLDYDPHTGLFRWKDDIYHWRAGMLAGTESEMGERNNKRRYVVISIGTRATKRRRYTLINIRKHLYRAHRLVWLYVHGEWPDNEIDHINGDGTDNRIANLRLATRSQNVGNTRTPKHNTSGFKGAYWNKRAGRWFAQIRHQKKQYHLGHFDTVEEAHAAYAEAARRMRGAFARIE